MGVGGSHADLRSDALSTPRLFFIGTRDSQTKQVKLKTKRKSASEQPGHFHATSAAAARVRESEFLPAALHLGCSYLEGFVRLEKTRPDEV